MQGRIYPQLLWNIQFLCKDGGATSFQKLIPCLDLNLKIARISAPQHFLYQVLQLCDFKCRKKQFQELWWWQARTFNVKGNSSWKIKPIRGENTKSGSVSMNFRSRGNGRGEEVKKALILYMRPDCKVDADFTHYICMRRQSFNCYRYVYVYMHVCMWRRA